MSPNNEPTGTCAGSVGELPVEQARRLNEACDVFEVKWRAGGRPDIWAAVLELPESLWPVAVRELIQLDVYYRHQRGESPVVADYAQRFPALDEEWLGAVVAGDPVGATLGNSRCDTVILPRVVPAGGFENYELLEVIGQGAMGIVYRARDRRFNRTVAVKVLQDRYAARSLAAVRFVDEAKITGQLQHPGIPPVHEVGELPNGRPFLVMKLITGRTLSAVVRAGDLRGAPLLAVCESICQAVGYAHSHGVIHRDLKPSNVMVGAFGEVQVMDWGLAKLGVGGGGAGAGEEPVSLGDSDGDPGLTRTGAVLGTPAFMAPEQARGEAGAVDERADVFGLGALACFILTDEPPFAAPSAAEAMRLAGRGDLSAAFARLDACGADPEQVALCKRCLSADRDDRPRNAGAVAAAVHEFRVASEERARQAELDRVRAEGERARAELRATEQRKRRKVQLALLGAVMLLVTGGGAVAWWQDKQATARKIEETRQASEKGGRETRNRDRFVIALEQCENALRAEDADMAALPLTEVENRVPEGGVEDFTPRVERCRKDLAMLEELDRIDNLRWTPTGRGFPTSPPIAEEWKQAFTRFGIVPGTTPVTEVVRLVNDSLIRDRLLTSLDLWLPSSPSRPDLAELLKALDPDDYRDAVRAAIRTTDADWRRYLFNHPKALEQPPRFAVVLGALYGPAERKRAILMRVMVGKPGNLAVLMALGATYRGDLREHAAERVRWYQAAVAARPRNVAAWVNLGSALVYMGEVDAAGDALKVAIQLDRKFATTARVNLGPLLENEGDVNGAVADYKKRLKDRPALIHHRVLVWSQGSDPTRSAKGDVNGDVNGHIVELKDLVELDPENWLLHQTLGSALMASGDVDGAIAAYEKLVELFPQHGYAHYQLGLAWEHKREYDRAIAAYQTLIASSAKAGVKSGESKAHARVGWLLFYEKKERAAGEAHLREATRLAPRVAQFHNDLGCVLRDSGRLGNAVACFQKAIELDPKYAHPVRNTGTVLEQRGDLDGAIQQYEKAIAIATTFAVARQDLDRVRKLKAERRPVPEAPLPREKKQP